MVLIYIHCRNYIIFAASTERRYGTVVSPHIESGEGYNTVKLLYANLYKAREYKQEAIDCYQTILENFPDTALAPKARQILTSMGVTVVEPAVESEDGETTGQAASMEGEMDTAGNTSQSETMAN